MRVIPASISSSLQGLLSIVAGSPSAPIAKGGPSKSPTRPRPPCGFLTMSPPTTGLCAAMSILDPTPDCSILAASHISRAQGKRRAPVMLNTKPCRAAVSAQANGAAVSPQAHARFTLAPVQCGRLSLARTAGATTGESGAGCEETPTGGLSPVPWHPHLIGRRASRWRRRPPHHRTMMAPLAATPVGIKVADAQFSAEFEPTAKVRRVW